MDARKEMFRAWRGQICSLLLSVCGFVAIK